MDTDKEHYTEGMLASVGRLRDSQKVGEWRVCKAAGKLIKATKHKSKQEKP